CRADDGRRPIPIGAATFRNGTYACDAGASWSVGAGHLTNSFQHISPEAFIPEDRMSNPTLLYDILRSVASQYPKDLIAEQVRDIPRIAFHIRLVLDGVKPKPPSNLALCDLGGGIGLFSVGCAAYGIKRTVLVDDFDDRINYLKGASILDLHRS